MDILRETETIPTTWPEVAGVSARAAAVDPAPIWQRIEAWIAYRWVNRQIVWVVDGIADCEFRPPKGPVTSFTALDVWTGTAWDTAPLITGPLDGLIVPHDGTYRITARIGTGDPPASVLEAFRRLADYHGQVPLVQAPGASAYSATFQANDTKNGPLVFTFDGDVDGSSLNTLSATRDPKYIARAMQYSGAADMLRPYRKFP